MEMFSRGIISSAILVLLLAVTPSLLAESDPSKNEYCEADTCVKKCRKFNSKQFKNSPSIITYFPEGRLGNKISAFLFLFWLKLDFDLDVYYEKESLDVLIYIFENVDGTVKVLEDELCNWRDFGFKKYEGDIELLGLPEWSTGKAVQLYIDKKNFMRHEIQGGRRYIKQFRKETLHALKPRPKFTSHAFKTMTDIAKKIGKKPEEVTFVGIHNRRTDYLEFRKKTLKLKNLYQDYFNDAMEYFNEEYENVVFLYVSDDMEWGKTKLGKKKNIFFVGCGNGDDLDCVGNDFAILSKCNHTITTHGSFGTWTAILAGGEIYTEYGAIVP